MFATTTPFPAPESGEYLDFQQFADLAELSIFTVRTQWEEYKMPFELIAGRRVIRRPAAEKWIRERAEKQLAGMQPAFTKAEQQYQTMLERQDAYRRQAAMGRK